MDVTAKMVKNFSNRILSLILAQWPLSEREYNLEN